MKVHTQSGITKSFRRKKGPYGALFLWWTLRPTPGAYVPEDGIQADLPRAMLPMRRVEPFIGTLNEDHARSLTQQPNIEVDAVVDTGSLRLYGEEIVPAGKVAASILKTTNDRRQLFG